jgi:hypothetical protein
VLLIALALGVRAFAQENAEALVANWFRMNPRSEAYAPIREQLADSFRLAAQESIPSELLLELLDEGASRGVPAPRLLATLKTRLLDFIQMKKSLDRFAVCLAGKAAPGNAVPPARLRNFASLLRRGVPLTVIESTLDAACEQKKDFPAALAVLRALANVSSLRELPSERVAALGKALLKSRLSPAGFSTLNALYIKGKLKNLTTGQITDIIIAALEEGKGLVRIDQELNRAGGNKQ